jgi:hypothetical protein
MSIAADNQPRPRRYRDRIIKISPATLPRRAPPRVYDWGLLSSIILVFRSINER